MAFSRHFPPGCAITTNPIPHSSYTSLHTYTRTYPSSLPSSSSSKPPKTFPHTDSSTWRRSISAVKTNPTTVTKPKPNGIEKGNERERVVEMLRLFRERCDKISRADNGVKRVDVKANSELKNEGKIVNLPASMIGEVPGVEIGDKFYYRVELMIVGLHRLWQSGIDHMCLGSGEVKFATCIVATEKHLDKMNDPNVLMYVGEGGHLYKNEVGVPPDQQLKGGNLALWNSMKEKKPVRVVRGLSYGSYKQKLMYVYDGLYLVCDSQHKKGPLGNMTFEFRLVRCPGQPLVPWSEYRRC